MERVKKEVKERVMNMVNKVNDTENYETRWDEKGDYKVVSKLKVKKGGLSRAQGARFELKVRKDLEEKGRIVDKWTNNVDLEEGKLVKAKRKYNPFKKMLIVGTGFPDFIAFKLIGEKYDIIGVESKINGILSKTEKEKCRWLLNNKIFSEILMAKKGEKRGEIEYINLGEKYEIK